MFGVTSEGIEVRSWLKKLSGVLSYPLANQVLPRYRPIGGAVPSTFIIDRKGVLRVARAGAFSETAFRSEEHTSELQSLMRISSAVFCLKKINQNKLDILIYRQCHRQTTYVLTPIS